ncbi:MULTISPECIES: anti-sigma factor [Cyanophyceae]|uniref:anti-sigma factor n=1 Tax=Cyanophyceae TaxID=3028117 RepID=UPI0016891FB2|nr:MULTISPECIES: anti-sigma factor [Cyanophyceae]MBD1916070.1 anti-sigma factor [Phormidium sp. FACHB-77]MBD2031661.1 anti-sigma factor [Phormidium sp. FACHB-322]MBD2052712.1 anti-sigma factor [Leptolyngbya sp. FACHB-60]
MTGSISSEQLQHLLAGYVLYDLSPEESATLADLLAANPNLQQDIDQLQQALEIAYDGDPVSPPAHLRMALLQTAAHPVASEAEAVSAPVVPLGLRPHRWGQIWVAAAAALIAGLSLSNLMLWRTLQLERASQPEDEILTIALGSPEDGASSGQAQVVINPSTLAGSLTVENLPPLEPGAVYVLWTVVDPSATTTVDQKNAILTTVFTVDEQGQVSQPIDLPPVYRRDRDLVRAVAITKESAAAPQEHLSPPLLIQPL